MKRFLCGIVLWFLLLWGAFGGVMEVPRKVHVISTEYFDILFSKESTETAVLLADSADGFYLLAKESFGLQFDFKLLVVISPDSQVLSVKYSPAPYNRIVVYEGSKNLEQEGFRNGLLDLFRYEVTRAVSQSVRNEFWYKVSNFVGGDSLQPVALVNMPFSFLEGAVNAEMAGDETGLLYDSWNLQLLAQMKLENKMPDLLQFFGAMDIYPGDKFVKVTGSAFCAYIQQRWGLEKFAELWCLSGKVQFFKFNKTIFEQVYGYSLQRAWEDFFDSIPVISVEKDSSALFFDFDNDSVYKFLMHTPYGFVWYDQMKGEVDIFDDYSLFNIRELLFLASQITEMSVTPEGRYLIVKFIQSRERENFKKIVTKIFDLKERRFVKGKEFSQELSEICGAVEHLYDKGSDNGVYSPVVLGEGHYGALVSRENQWFFEIYTLGTGITCETSCETSSFYQIKFDGELLKARNLRGMDLTKLELPENLNNRALFFDFVLEDFNSFARTGVILLNKDYCPERVFVMDCDYSGGINDCILLEDKLYYFSHKFTHDEFRFVQKDEVSFTEAEIVYPNVAFAGKNSMPKPKITETADGKFLLSGYELGNYNPWGVMFHGKWTPLMPVYDITVENEIEMIPGLGVTFETQSDPFSNNRIVLSAGAMYFPLDFTKLFNASEESKAELEAKREDFGKDIAFTAYGENSSTPLDLSIGSIYRFNLGGEYALKIIGGAKYVLPLRMDFRKLMMNVKLLYSASTSYWDSHQIEIYPNLSDWPDFKNSYRSWQGVMALEYTNVHQYGISPFKKMGIDGGILLTSTWDRNFQEFQKKHKQGKISESNPNLTQRWNSIYAPTQINIGGFVNIEIPQILPFQNYYGWIFSLPVSINGELFYTNGTALMARTEVLLIGRELQKGFDKINVYFSRFGLYGGYEVSMDYDITTVVLPDLRDIYNFYDISTSCYLNDSVFARFIFYTTPAVGKFSVDQIISNLNLQYYIRKNEWKLNFKMEFKLQ